MTKTPRTPRHWLLTAPLAAAALALQTPDRPAARKPEAPSAVPPPAVTGKQVLLVYRSNHPDANGDGVGDSEEIARYYAQRRGVPKANLLGIRVAGEGDLAIDSRQAHWTLNSFLHRLVKPLTRKLDEIGRDGVLYIVVCQGMPCRVKVPEKRNESADQLLGLPFQLRLGLAYPTKHANG